MTTPAASTEYIVLLAGSDGRYEVVGSKHARDAAGAIKAAAPTINSEAGWFVAVAVPARSWQPIKVTPKVETTLILEDAK